MCALKLAVVGHTNTGKTSLMRTLAHDASFGEVSPRPSATRHVEGLSLLAGGERVIDLFDTPGLEDPIGLLDALEAQAQPGERLDGPARIERFLHSSAAATRFEQEAKVLRQLLACDAGLIVIDSRDPVLAKYRDELTLLSMCGKPLLPVLNFIHSTPNHQTDWQDTLARHGLHSVVAFDTVTPLDDGEQRLLSKLMLLLDAHAEALQRLMNARSEEAASRREAAAQRIAALLLDVAAYRMDVPAEDEAALHNGLTQMRDTVRQAEIDAIRDLLALYRFRPDDVESSGLPMLQGRWNDDLFSEEALKRMGIRLSRGLVAGAAAGIGIDLVLGGLTLGAATLAGAAAGGLWQLGQMYGGKIIGKLRGVRSLSVDDAILRLLALRQLWLLDVLQQRGHAAMERIALDAGHHLDWRKDRLPDALSKARSRSEWSQFNADFDADARLPALGTLSAMLVSEQAGSAKPR